MAKRKAAPKAASSTPAKRTWVPAYTYKPHHAARIIYPKPTPEAVRAVLGYYNAAVAHLQAPSSAPVPLPDPKHLVAGLPHGPIRLGREGVHGTYPFIDFELAYGGGARAKARGFTTPAGFLVLRALCLFDGEAFNRNHSGPEGLSHVPVLAEGFHLAELLASTDSGEVVKLESRGALVPWHMTIKPGRGRAGRLRNDAIGHALRRYEKFAHDWDLARVLSLDGYEALLKGSFRLFDYEHGRSFMQIVEPGLVVDPLG